MRTYTIQGGVPLRGEIRVSGAKNAATKELVACLLADEPVTLENVPQIGDVDVTISMLRDLGAKIQQDGGTVIVDARDLGTAEVSAEFSRKNRIPILLLGPLLHRFGRAVIPALGGCTIGARPIDFHLEALRRMGADVECDEEKYTAIAKKRLVGTTIELPYPSVGATENSMLTAVKARGTTMIKNAAIEPEIMDLALLLQSMGAIIKLDVNRTWIIEGVDHLHGAVHRVVPDRIEAASFAAAAALTGGDIFVRDAEQAGLMQYLNALRQVGVPYEIKDTGIRFMSAASYKPTTIETDVHPGFMTDWQQPFVILLTQADGVSIVHETVYEDRFGYTEALVHMGAKIQLQKDCLGLKPCRFANRDYKHSAIIVGKTPLQAADIIIPDLRAGFSYLIAALIAEGESHLTGVELIERGYENIIGKMKSVGAKIDAQ